MKQFLTKFNDLDPVALSLIGVLLVITGALFFIAWVLDVKNKRTKRKEDFWNGIKRIERNYHDNDLFI